MDFAEFLRVAEARAERIMWFLGAGCSQAAGVPTAHDLIWRFKRKIYCSEERVPETRFSDLANPEVQQFLQRYFDTRGAYPEADSPEEYAFYFERAYPDERDRRRILERALEDAAPSHGHYVLAALMRERLLRVLWTTNFDPLIEDAANRIFSSGRRLTVADLDSSQIALDAINEERWPVLGKLHGDFRSTRLMNTTTELQEQDAELRRALIESCKRLGLAVIGYSGRDKSVMASFYEAITSGGRPFPFGLFWFHYGEGQPDEGVSVTLDRARSNGIEAQLLNVGVFDEVFGDLSVAFPPAHQLLTDQDITPAARLLPAPLPTLGNRWPIIRTNALPITNWPSTARLVQCGIGGVKEVRAAIEAAEADVLATRRRGGVVAFGRDSEVRRTLESFVVSDWDLHALDLSNQMELGLVYDALAQAIGRDRPVRAVRAGRRQFLTIEPARVRETEYALLKKAVRGRLTGKVPGTGLTWWEAVALRPDYRQGMFWLLVEPTIFTEATEDEALRRQSGAFVRNRIAGRYNAAWNDFFDAWVSLICGGRTNVRVRAFGIEDGVDAAFEILGKTAFSRRGNS